MSEPDVAKVNELARRLADAFEQAGLRYAIGGAISLVYAAAARTTNDVDINLFDEGEVDRAFDVLRRLGASFDEEEARRTIEERGDFRARLEGYRLDIFVAFSDVHEKVARRRLLKPLLGRPVWVLSPEDLVVFKMIFDRPKDWLDIAAVAAARTPEFDLDYIRAAFERWVGPGDPRIERLEELIRTYPA